MNVFIEPDFDTRGPSLTRPDPPPHQRTHTGSYRVRDGGECAAGTPSMWISPPPALHPIHLPRTPRATAPPVEATLVPPWLCQCAVPKSPILSREYPKPSVSILSTALSILTTLTSLLFSSPIQASTPYPHPSSACPSPRTPSHRCSGVAVGRDPAPLLGGARAARRLHAARRRRTIDLAGRANDGQPTATSAASRTLAPETPGRLRAARSLLLRGWRAQGSRRAARGTLHLHAFLLLHA